MVLNFDLFNLKFKNVMRIWSVYINKLKIKFKIEIN
jgi:hypothetical protein